MYLVLSGDMEQFAFGMPEWLHGRMLAMTLNLMLGVYLFVCAIRHWVENAGTLSMRVLYSLVGLMVTINLWISWYFNIASSIWHWCVCQFRLQRKVMRPGQLTSALIERVTDLKQGPVL